MADEEKVNEAAPPKKGGNKFAIIGICAAMLVTGGFFGLKMRSMNGPKTPPKLELGEIVPIKEFLVNLQDRSGGTQVYLRTELNFQLAKGYQKEEFDKYTAPVQDAINRVLSANTVEKIRSVPGKADLKRKIAEQANLAIFQAQGKQPPKSTGQAEKEGWDSDTGPILKVYFTSFAFQ